ncbi:MAG: RsmE family RNA methyltransferase [Planctomycetes bacterium]|nr:RsmE family RNA methyltransferase [Planctomycetota bacterium]
MSTRRFYAADLTPTLIELDDEQARHARKSLRLAIGDRVSLFNGLGDVAAGIVREAGRSLVIERQAVEYVAPLTPAIDLAVAIPKGARADGLIEKASELGADRLIPLLTDRSIVDPREGKLDRFARMAIESAKQCGRPHLLHINPPTRLTDLFAARDHDVKLIADTADAPGVHDLPTRIRAARRVLVLIGPEGGWTDAERAAAKARNFIAWRLGPHVMRIETAAAAALAILRGLT